MTVGPIKFDIPAKIEKVELHNTSVMNLTTTENWENTSFWTEKKPKNPAKI